MQPAPWHVTFNQDIHVCSVCFQFTIYSVHFTNTVRQYALLVLTTKAVPLRNRQQLN